MKPGQSRHPDFFSQQRIAGNPVKAFFPEHGALRAILFGEAPGPRGADQSGIPFWGDAAGIPLYRALKEAGYAEFSESVWNLWDGQRLRAAGELPILREIALSNAFPQCPTDDGYRFRAPKKSEWASEANQSRLAEELEQAAQRGASRIVTLGRCAAQALERLASRRPWQMVHLPHPSSQGLLMDAPGKGRGMRLSDLQSLWQKRLVDALRSSKPGDP